jgi:hypothetical protein
MGFPLTDTNPPTVEAVSGAMQKARYLEAVTVGGEVIASGWRAWQESGEVRVTRVNMSTGPGETLQSTTDAALERYTGVLRDAGWQVVADAGGGFVTVLGAPGEVA